MMDCLAIWTYIKSLTDLRYALSGHDHPHNHDDRYLTEDEVMALLALSQGAQVGDIKMIAYEPAPDGWLTCDGTTLLIGDYPELYAVIGNTFEPDPQPYQFRLPNFRSIFPIGTDFEDRVIGDTDGEATHTLTISEIPSHYHPLPFKHPWVAGAGGVMCALANDWVVSGYAGSSGSVGGGEAHNNMPPCLAIHFVIYAGR
jgi:microcystin-dependent protein